MACRRRILPRPLHRPRTRFLPALLFATCLFPVLSIRNRAVAQAVVFTGDTPADPAAAKKAVGFSVRKEDRKFVDALDDFGRYVEKKAWDRAFRSIATLAESDPKGMVPATDGFFVPARQRVWRSLTGLPPEGKQAFRLFNDAQARQLLTKAQAAGEEASSTSSSSAGNEEIATLRKLFDQYFITSVGDQAADRLGDALYETGDYLGAAAAWDAILTDFPDTALPRLKLQTKRGLALARAGQWDQFDALLKNVRETAAGQTVTIGGKQVVSAEFLASLPRTSSVPTTQPTTRPADTQPSPGPQQPFALPPGDEPLWYVRFFDETLQQQLQTQMMQGYVNAGALNGYVPPAGTDGRRVYVNLLGVVFAVDAQTGKLVWRTRKFSELGDKFQMFLGYGVDITRYSLVTAPEANAVLVSGINLDRLNYGNEPARLVCLAGDTGAIKWSSANVGWAASGSGAGASNWSMAGPPLVSGKTLYVVAHRAGGQEMTLFAVSLDTGKSEWAVPLGTPQAGSNYRGQLMAPAPALVEYGGSVYVLTNNGALLAVNVAARRLDWAFTYDMPGIIDAETMMNFGYNMPPSRDAPGAAVVRDGVLYLKETGGAEMYAIDLAGPSLRWRRPLSPRETIGRIRNEFVFLAGEDVSALDLRGDRTLKWSAQLPAETEKLRPVITDDSLYVFLGRGVYQISLTNGDTTRIFRGYDRDSIGGMILELPDRFVTVSNLAVTAYPVPVPTNPAGKVGKR